MSDRHKLFSLLALLFVFLAGHCFAADTDAQYFFEREAASGNQSSCEKIMGKMNRGESLDTLTGDIIYNLKYINIHYLLEDYDDATKPGSQKKYVNLDDLRTEIEAQKRDIYCRIEFTIRLNKQPAKVTSVYQDFIGSALEKIGDTYKSAQKSLDKKSYERAMYAFDLIAPYQDSYSKYLETAAILTPTSPPEMLVADKTTAEPVDSKTPQAQGIETTPAMAKQTSVKTEHLTAKAEETDNNIAVKIEQYEQQTEAVLAETKTATMGPILKAVLVSQSNTYLGPISKAANNF